jgi:hypothetical protein
MTARSGNELHATLYQGNLLNPAVRREIADLNRLFLERALHPVDGVDAWFRLPAAAAARLGGASLEVRERAAQSPIALFEVCLPRPDHPAYEPGCEVAEDPAEPGTSSSRAEARRAFGMTALGVVRRLIEGVPLAPRIAFGLDAHVEAQLCSMTLSQSYRVAAWSGLIRPRWPGHDWYWALLAEAATRGDGVEWAYAAGLCLVGPCERQPATVTYSTRRQARPAHRRLGTDVPC